jgi:hypothetical protein
MAAEKAAKVLRGSMASTLAIEASVAELMDSLCPRMPTKVPIVTPKRTATKGGHPQTHHGRKCIWKIRNLTGRGDGHARQQEK